MAFLPSKETYEKRLTLVRNNLVKRTSMVTLPGMQGLSLSEVIEFFINGIQKGSLTTRASSIAFQFFLAAIPAVIFFFTLLPYIPVNNFQDGLFSMLVSIMPKAAYSSIQTTLDEIFVRRIGLQFFGFLIAVFFSMNAINSIIKAFNASYHTIESRSWIARKMVSLALVFIVATLISIAISLMIFTRFFLMQLTDLNIIRSDLTFLIINSGKWIIIAALIFFTISFIYYLAPSRKMKWKLISPGSTLASVLTIFACLAFSFFMNQFGQLDKIYGSLGSVMIVMIWINFNALALLIGFELNASIMHARNNHNEVSTLSVSYEKKHTGNKKRISVKKSQ
ncbi:MAG TPA: YihY/virulence factor BrkB family protein [Bacteroidales bacterium]|nr:YihY/virulence factor BrkB family protein [Bacteroidales bacterium]